MKIKELVFFHLVFLLIFLSFPLSVRAETAEEWKLKGNEYLDLEDWEKALECYEKSLEIDPCYARSAMNMGYVYKKLKEYDKAMECFDLTLELSEKGTDTSDIPPSYPWVHKGYLFADMKEYEKAMECSDKAMELAPENFYTWDCRGYILKAMKNYEEALISYDKAIEIDPTQDYVWKDKGFVLYNWKRYGEALECYDKALELNPDDPEILTGKGNCYSDMKMFDEGLQCYDKALEIEPDFLPALINKSTCLFSYSMNEDTDKKYLEGKEYLDNVKALNLEPEDINADDSYRGNITLLHLAAIYRDKEFVQSILSAGIDLNIKTREGFTPFHLSCLNAFANPNPVLNSGDYKKEAIEITEFFLEKGVDINSKVSEDNLLHFAVKEGNKEMAEFLVKKGADVNMKNDDGKSPLYLAEETGQEEILKILQGGL